MMPTVSVLIATRNYAAYLREAIASVLAQTWTDYELIVVDDGSTDSTPEVVAAFDDPRIVSARTVGIGTCAARNLAIELARGDCFAFLDGDDIWLPTKLERQIRLLRAHPEIGLVSAWRMTISPEGGILASHPIEQVRGDVYREVLLSNPICFSSAMVRRTCIEHVGGFREDLDLAVDYDLWLRVVRHYAADAIDEVLVKYRTGHASLSVRAGERLHSVLSTIRRSVGTIAPPGREEIDARTRTLAVTSTMRSLGFLHRSNHPASAASWYLRAATRDGRWLASFRAIGGTIRAWLRRRITGTDPDRSAPANAPVNR